MLRLCPAQPHPSPQDQGSETPDVSFLQPVPKGLQLLLKEEQADLKTALEGTAKSSLLAEMSLHQVVWAALWVASAIPRCHTPRELPEHLQWGVEGEERWKTGSFLAVYPAEVATALNLHTHNSCRDQSRPDISTSNRAKFKPLPNTDSGS